MAERRKIGTRRRRNISWIKSETLNLTMDTMMMMTMMITMMMRKMMMNVKDEEAVSKLRCLVLSSS